MERRRLGPTTLPMPSRRPPARGDLRCLCRSGRAGGDRPGRRESPQASSPSEGRLLPRSRDGSSGSSSSRSSEAPRGRRSRRRLQARPDVEPVTRQCPGKFCALTYALFTPSVLLPLRKMSGGGRRERWALPKLWGSSDCSRSGDSCPSPRGSRSSPGRGRSCTSRPRFPDGRHGRRPFRRDSRRSTGSSEAGSRAVA
jgi:hypothetical protein